MNILKHILKDWFLILKIRNRFNPSIQIQQRRLFHYYQDLAQSNKVPNLIDTGFRVFSQNEEDGKLLFIFSIIGMYNKQFVEIGANDGINSNCANLFFNFGWYGLFIDCDKWSVERGRRFYNKYPNPLQYKPKFICKKVTLENVNQIIGESGINGEIGLLSIDIDGNDYWVWDALSIIEPKVVIIETHNEFGLNDIVVPYESKSEHSRKHPVYHGASPVAMVKLAKKKGYRLVGANQLGFNFIFIKNGIVDSLIPEVSVESVLTHPSILEGYKSFEEIKGWDYVKS
jgi:hypothetical protein